MDNAKTIRYLMPRPLFEQLCELISPNSPDSLPVGGYIFAQYNAPFVIVDSFEIVPTTRDYHTRPKSWMHLKRHNIRTIREYKAVKIGQNNQPITVVYPFHTHPNKEETLHLIDQKILLYYGSGVMVICTPNNVIGWYYHRSETGRKDKNPWIPMPFEVIEEVIPNK